jgi:hypothetical protein
VKHKITKLADKIGKNLHVLEFGDDFLDRTPKAYEITKC